MVQIRRNCFETNSSSTHSLVMCEDDTYKALENKEAFLVGSFGYGMDIVQKENLLESLDRWNKEQWEKYCKETGLDPKSTDDFVNEILNGFDKTDDNDLMSEFHTLDQLWDNYELETYDQGFTTKDGKIIHAFGAYGFDG